MMRWAGAMAGVVLSGVVVCGGAVAQGKPGKAGAERRVTALMMSDIHFDPFRDPAKAARLVESPEGAWNGILSEADSADQAEAFATLQRTCHETAIDSSYALLRSSLAAMKANAPEAQLATVTGDLLVHNLACRFKTLLPGKTESDYKAFAEKTTTYVLHEVRQSLAGVQVYAALGNNDSSCKDYSLDVDDAYLTAVQEAVVGGLPVGTQRTAAMASFRHRGDYAVTMAQPMQRTRLIVLDDLFQSRRYTDCSGKPNAAAVDAQVAWLEAELAGAKQRGERVWVMGHIPPGLDSYSTILQHKNVCAGELPVMFLSSERLAETMGRYAEVIQLGLFGHSHMDEMRLFGGVEDGTGVQGKVAIKMVPSITPLASGIPEFTVATIDTGKARLVDYAVYAGSNATGVDEVWKKTYSFGEAYHLAEFSPVALDGLMQGFVADRGAQEAMSKEYLRHVVAGEKAMMLSLLWPRYACVMEHHTAKGYAACFCPAP